MASRSASFGNPAVVPGNEEVSVAELEAQLATAKVEKLEKELQAARLRQANAARAASSSSQAPPPNAEQVAVEAAAKPNTHPKAAADAADEEKVRQLMEMGFSRYQSLVALEKTGGNAERAANQLLEEQIQEPTTPVQQLEEMGFSRSDAIRALASHYGCLQAAVQELTSAEHQLNELDVSIDVEELAEAALQPQALDAPMSDKEQGEADDAGVDEAAALQPEALDAPMSDKAPEVQPDKRPADAEPEPIPIIKRQRLGGAAGDEEPAPEVDGGNGRAEEGEEPAASASSSLGASAKAKSKRERKSKPRQANMVDALASIEITEQPEIQSRPVIDKDDAMCLTEATVQKTPLKEQWFDGYEDVQREMLRPKVHAGDAEPGSEHQHQTGVFRIQLEAARLLQAHQLRIAQHLEVKAKYYTPAHLKEHADRMIAQAESYFANAIGDWAVELQETSWRPILQTDVGGAEDKDILRFHPGEILRDTTDQLQALRGLYAAGQHLGFQLKIFPDDRDGRRLLKVYGPIRSALQLVDYATGVPCEHLKASWRISTDQEEDVGHHEPADPLQASLKENHDEETAASSSSKRPRVSMVDTSVPTECSASNPSPGVTGPVNAPRFSLLSCAALPEAPARPSGFLLDLYPTQRRTVFWMASREGVKIDGFPESDTSFHGFASVQRFKRRVGKPELAAALTGGEAFLPAQQLQEKHEEIQVQMKVERCWSNAKGGLVADKVGNGKTALILALIALTRHNEPLIADSPELVKNKKFIRSRATLVMLPPNLFDQWRREIEKFLSEDFKIKYISNFTALKSMSVRDLRTADIVLVCRRLLVSDKYEECLDEAAGQGKETIVVSGRDEYKKAHKKWRLLGKLHAGQENPELEPQREDFEDRVVTRRPEVTSKRFLQRSWTLHERLSKMDQAQLETLDEMKIPPLELFLWRRLVVDELHEDFKEFAEVLFGGDYVCVQNRSKFHNFDSLQADSRWGLTATPNLSSAAHVSCLAWFHRVFIPRDCDLEAQNYLDDYVRCNDLDMSLIPIEHHLIPVRHTGLERALYLNRVKGGASREDLCQILNFFSPDDGDDDMISAINSTRSDNAVELEKHREAMEKKRKKIAELKSREERGWPKVRGDDKLRDKLRQFEKEIPEMEQKERRLESKRNYFEEVLKSLQRLEEATVECTVCFEKMAPDDCSVTSCGHLFCKDCITSCITKNGECPTCRASLQLHSIAPAKEILSRNQEAGPSLRVRRFGSKVEAVCNQLKNIWKKEEGAKVIIFVQFQVLLKKMEGALTSLGLSCLTMRGHIFERRRAISQFHNHGQENQILLLSLERSPTGMNLVCCHHLILVHPMVAENRETALSFERQAIGRVRRQGQTEKVNVYRLFVRETMEEELVREHHQLLADQTPEDA